MSERASEQVSERTTSVGSPTYANPRQGAVPRHHPTRTHLPRSPSHAPLSQEHNASMARQLQQQQSEIHKLSAYKERASAHLQAQHMTIQKLKRSVTPKPAHEQQGYRRHVR